MMDEYLTDDEELERVKRVVAENWAWVVGGVALGAALIFGYRFYDNHRNARALAAAAQFDDMTAALDHDDAARSRQLAAGIIHDFPGSPYADQAQLTLARLAVEAGKPGEAVAALTLVMNESKDTELRHIARLRLARVQIDQGNPDTAISTLAADQPGSFSGLYHEVRGDAYHAKKDFKDALAEYQAALGDGPPGSVADAGLLQLKIADLGPPSAPAPATAMVPPSAPALTGPPPPATSTKAKP